MRNKGFFWGITIALILATIYQLSFTLATSSVEKDAKLVAIDKVDSLTNNGIEYIITNSDTLYVAEGKDLDLIKSFFADAYLKEVANDEAHFTGATYAEAQKKEIKLGLDLKGGMSVTLEISVPELVYNLAGKTKKSDFFVPYTKAIEITNNGDGDFIETFVAQFEANTPDGKLAKLFHRYNKDDIAVNATNDEVADFLAKKANDALDGVEIIIEKRVNTTGVAQPTITKEESTNRIFVELPGIKDKESVRRKMVATANLEFYETYDNAYDNIGNLILGAESQLSKELFGDILGQNTPEADTTNSLELNLGENEASIDTTDTTAESTDLLSLNNDEDTTATAEEETVTEQDSLSNEQQRQLRPISSYLALSIQFDPETGTPTGFIPGATVGYAQVIDTSLINSRLNHSVFVENMPEDLTFMWAAKELTDDNKQETGLLYLYAIKTPKEGAPVRGDDVAKSYVTADFGKIGVTMKMTPNGAGKWGELTEKNIGKQVAITMDNLVFSAPVVNEKMFDNASITGGFDREEAKDLAGLLNAGSLPAPLDIVDETSVGPTLGAENINSGMYSFGFAILLVLIYMIFYYGKAGIIADLALIINIFLMVGALASFGAVLTLPGIAGIVLTIGMSVDANVLIFERIREELRAGKGNKAAIDEGFRKALTSILDANITTLLTGVVLLIFGHGPIKGFAITLIIGIFTSFFAAVVVSRLMFSAATDKNVNFNFSTGITKNWFTNTNIAFIAKRKIFYVLSGSIILVGLIFLVTRGLDKGVDFTGGRTYTVEFKDKVDINSVRSELTTAFESEPTVKTLGDSYTAAITTKYLITDKSNDANQKVEDALTTGLTSFGEFEITSNKTILPTVSRELISNSIYAVVFSLVIIFLYIVFRFRKWQYGLGALLAMAHDVLVVLGLFAIFWGYLGFSMEIDQAFIAAILTVVGYSINDTVVVFDRIREYLGMHANRDKKDVINAALNSTMSRTINTSLSTFIVLLIIFLFGGEAIKGFTFALMIGVIVGTYSSLFIATPTVVDFEKKESTKK